MVIDGTQPGLSHTLDKVSLFYIFYFSHPYWDGGWPHTLGDAGDMAVSQETLNSPKRKRLTLVSRGHKDLERERGVALGVLGPWRVGTHAYLTK